MSACDYVITISAPGRQDVIICMPYPSDHSARSAAHRIEDSWVRRCEVLVCRQNGEVIYHTDSLRRWREKQA